MKRNLKEWQKALCGILAASVLAMGGFMGVRQFMPKERSLTIVNDAAVATSRQMTADDTDTNSGTDGSGENDGTSEVKSNGSEMKINGKSAILIDGSSGKVLFAQNEKKHLPPASVTKVMTLLLVLEACDSGKIGYDDKVTISERAASMGGSQMYMEPGEQHTVEELLKGVIMCSANDGCVALAEYLCGSVEEFVDTMNKRAQEMGLVDSHFVNTNGLPVADHYSCAYDIGMISKELMKHEKAHPWFTSWQEDIKVGLPGKESKFTLTNTNKLVRNYNGAIGVKTGYTDDAGYCLSGAARRGDTTLIGVVLGSKTSDIRFAEMTRLLDYGFANYETVQVSKKGEKLETVTVEKGEQQKLYAVAMQDIGITVKKDSREKVKKKVSIKENITLPIKKGETIGTVAVYEGKEKAAEYELVSDRTIQRASFLTTYVRMFKELI